MYQKIANPLIAIEQRYRTWFWTCRASRVAPRFIGARKIDNVFLWSISLKLFSRVTKTKIIKIRPDLTDTFVLVDSYRGQLLPPQINRLAAGKDFHAEANRISSSDCFWYLPERFNGNKLFSYGGAIQFNLFIDANSKSSKNPDIVITGNGLKMMYKGRFQSLFQEIVKKTIFWFTNKNKAYIQNLSGCAFAEAEIF